MIKQLLTVKIEGLTSAFKQPAAYHFHTKVWEVLDEIIKVVLL